MYQPDTDREENTTAHTEIKQRRDCSFAIENLSLEPSKNALNSAAKPHYRAPVDSLEDKVWAQSKVPVFQ